MNQEHERHEFLVHTLDDSSALEAYKKPYDGYRVGRLPRLLGGLLVSCGNLFYGTRPSYLKFRAIEVIARVPYHSWASASFTLLTAFYSNEERARRLSVLSRFTQFSAENETMHVVVVSRLACMHEQPGVIRYTLIPMLFAFFYFWVSYLLYMFSPRSSLELNYIFEQHAFDQYSEFLIENESELKSRPVESSFLAWYGRNPRSEYEFFRSVRNDELVHRNRSIHEIELHANHAAT